MKNRLTAFAFLILLFVSCRDDKHDFLVLIVTPYGEMTALLYEETPEHKKNFLKLAKEGMYDSTSFHRVIKQFMVQGGDINRIEGNAPKIEYTIPAEINSTFYHQKGALAAARMGDNVNPKRESSGCQFYIVHGRVFPESELRSMEDGKNYQAKQKMVRELLAMEKYQVYRQEVIAMQRAQDIEGLQAFMEKADSLVVLEFGENILFKFSDEQKRLYSTVGGAPHLDSDYTVFGKVVEGLNVIDSIAVQSVGPGDKPIKDIKMVIKLKKMSKKEITKRYGYQYPNIEE